MLERSVGGSIPIGGSLLVLPLLCDDADLVVGSGHSRSIGQRLIDLQGFAVPGLGRVEVAPVLVLWVEARSYAFATAVTQPDADRVRLPAGASMLGPALSTWFYRYPRRGAISKGPGRLDPAPSVARHHLVRRGAVRGTAVAPAATPAVRPTGGSGSRIRSAISARGRATPWPGAAGSANRRGYRHRAIGRPGRAMR